MNYFSMTRRFKSIILLLCLTVLGSLAMPGQSPRGIVRDLSRYDVAEAFEFQADEDRQKRDEKLGRIREFLWNHWTKKRRGFLQLRFWSAEGDPANYNLYIEPDKNGSWRVTSDYERQCCIEQVRRKLAAGIHFNTGILFYMILERRTKLRGKEYGGEYVEPGLPDYGKLLPRTTKRQGAQFVLLFRKEKKDGPDWLL